MIHMHYSLILMSGSGKAEVTHGPSLSLFEPSILAVYTQLLPLVERVHTTCTEL
jgi:hypothetical protein